MKGLPSARRGVGGIAALFAAVAAAVGAFPAGAAAQELGAKVAAVRNGTARFSFGTRPGVEVCDQGIRMGRRQLQWRSRGWNDDARNCREGSVDVEAEVRDGRVIDIDVPARESDRARDAEELGEVAATDAVVWLEGLVRGSDEARAARDAVFPMVLADVPEVWRTLMAIARDDTVGRGARKNVLFWLGQEAADAATKGIVEVASDEDEDQEVRDAAVFALSERPAGEGIPALMQVARTANQAQTRRSAMFWLAQSNDPRVVPFFEEILVGPGGN